MYDCNMYEITDLKPGTAIQIDGDPYLVLSSQFGRKSQSKANMQCKLKNIQTGAIVARNFQGSEKIEPADIGFRRVQYLYASPPLSIGSDRSYIFMDLQNYDQFMLDTGTVGEAAKYLIEGGEVDALVFGEKPIGIKLKPTVDIKVVETSPGVRGDTATGGGKPAKLASGLTINVPLFINDGDTVRINTETGAYKERVS